MGHAYILWGGSHVGEHWPGTLPVVFVPCRGLPAVILYPVFMGLGEVFDLTVETGYRGVGVDCRFMWRCRLNIVRATQKANSQTAILSFWKLWRKIENNLHVTKICRYFAPALMKEILLKSKVLKKSFSKKIFQKDLEVIEKPLTFAPASMKITLHERESS